MSDTDRRGEPVFWLSEPMALPAGHPNPEAGREFVVTDLATDVARIIHVVRTGSSPGADHWSIEVYPEPEDGTIGYDPEVEAPYLTEFLIHITRESLGPDPEPARVIERRRALFEARLAHLDRLYGREVARTMVGWLLDREQARGGERVH